MALEIILMKCNHCGAPLPVGDIPEGVTVVTCEHCGQTNGIVRVDENKINKETVSNLCRQAEEFMQEDRFDDAAKNYEEIIGKFGINDAEIYWRLLLARYGVKYVRDKKTQKYIPTVNRMSRKLITREPYYKKVLDYADASQKAVYQEKASQIDAILNGIIEIADEEEPYDVFICYKDRTENGEPTEDRFTGEKIYNRLHKEGFKVFFSHYTLEGKVGSEYEPRIFAAIHSAKVMIVIGSKPEYFNAVWVKNEWSRFNALVEKKSRDEKKMIFALYKNMDVYGVPSEIRAQHQDMNRVDWLENIVHVVNKYIAPQPVVSTEPVSKIGVRCTSCNKDDIIEYNGRDDAYKCNYCGKYVSIEQARKNFRNGNKAAEKKPSAASAQKTQGTQNDNAQNTTQSKPQSAAQSGNGLEAVAINVLPSGFSRVAEIEKTLDGGFVVVYRSDMRILQTIRLKNGSVITVGEGDRFFKMADDKYVLVRKGQRVRKNPDGRYVLVNCGSDEKTSYAGNTAGSNTNTKPAVKAVATAKKEDFGLTVERYEREYRKAKAWLTVTIAGVLFAVGCYLLALFVQNETVKLIGMAGAFVGLAAFIVSGYFGNLAIEKRSRLWWLLWLPAVLYVITVILGFILGQGLVLDTPESPLGIIANCTLILGLFAMIAMSVVRFVYARKDWRSW